MPAWMSVTRPQGHCHICSADCCRGPVFTFTVSLLSGNRPLVGRLERRREGAPTPFSSRPLLCLYTCPISEAEPLGLRHLRQAHATYYRSHKGLREGFVLFCFIFDDEGVCTWKEPERERDERPRRNLGWVESCGI